MIEWEINEWERTNKIFRGQICGIWRCVQFADFIIIVALIYLYRCIVQLNIYLISVFN
jgi:hypothetical protein